MVKLECTCNMKSYSKPQVIAKNLPSGSYAAGCPVNKSNSELKCTILSMAKGTNSQCKKCERSA